MPRLPQPGSDQGQWGQILNDYLSVTHTSDGSLKDNTITGPKLANDTIPAGKLTPTTQASLAKADTSVQSVNTVFPSSGNVTLTATDINAIPSTEKGQPNGVASLTGTSLTTSQLPATVITKSADSNDIGKAIDAYSGIPFIVATVNDVISSEESRDYADAALRRRVRGPVTCFLGDSITIIHSTPGTNPVYGGNWTMRAAHMMGGRMIRIGDHGVTDEAVAQIAARVPNVIAQAPDRCNVLALTNNTNAAGFDAALITYEEGIVQPLLAAGIQPILCTIPPRGGVRESAPTTWLNTLRANVFIRAMAAKYSVPLVDLYAAVVDPDTGDWGESDLGVLSGDAVHPTSVAGCTAMANAWVAAMNEHYPERAVSLPAQRYDTLSHGGDPLFLGGFTSGTGGKWPSGWNGSSTDLNPTAADPVDGDGLEAGKWLKLEKPVDGVSKNANLIRTLAQMSASVGDRIAFMCRYRVENQVGSATTSISLAFRNSGGSTVRSITPISQAADERSGVIYFEALIPATTHDLRVDISFSAADTIDLKLGQLMVVDLTTNGLPSLCAVT